jgi:hypothetical protein
LGWRGGSDFEHAAATVRASAKQHISRIRRERSLELVEIGMLTGESD